MSTQPDGAANFPPATLPHRPPSGGTAISAMVLCFLAAVGYPMSAALAQVATWLSKQSFASVDRDLGRIGKHLPQAVTSAVDRLSTTNTMTTVAALVLAVGWLIGGIMLYRRRLGSRIVISVTGVVSIVAGILLYRAAHRAFGELKDAVHNTDLSDARWTVWLDVDGLAPSLFRVIIGCIVTVVTVLLALLPSTKRWCLAEPDGSRYLDRSMTPFGQPPVAPGYQVAQPYWPPAPPPRHNSTTAIFASMLSIMGGLSCLLGTLGGVAAFADSRGSAAQKGFGAIFGLVSLGVAAGLIVGGIVLLTRRRVGQFLIVMSWTVALLLGIASIVWTWIVSQDDHRQSSWIWLVVGVFSALAVVAALTITLTLVPSTRRWCAPQREARAS